MDKLQMKDDMPELSLNPRRYIIAGLLVLLFGGGFSVYWLCFTYLDSAAIAPGTITVEGKRKSIEHFEGGIVERVLVKEGDMVEAGEPLIELSSISAKTRFSQLQQKLYSSLAQKQRLESERNGAETLEFSQDLLVAAESHPALLSVMKTQQLLFSGRQKLMQSELAVLDARLERVASDRVALEQKLKQEKRAFEYLRQEAAMHEELLPAGYTSKLKALEIQRTKARLSGDLMDLEGRLRNREMAQLEIHQQRLSMKHQNISQIEQELQELAKVMDDTVEQLTQAKDVLSRVVLSSPSTGRVVGLSVFNRGDVISPGETLMQVVPENDRLIVEASLKPEDIDVITKGQKAMVRLAAYSFRTTPPIEGEIIHVAADRLVSKDKSHEEGFVIKVAINPDDLAHLKNVKLHPGMPAEVFVVLNKRRPIDYLLEPLQLDLYRAFREM
ncbi:HlyD family type I secretion periplasmic adaptor subunit [Motilimonas cestriensis]|uniref:Membrane fusion protein (MFP) family protein n=1 Tax=Motilimonas cestriensis TaxID=2742685 RepID=A0ABS8W6V4_9GAMM|nr:HlyD family type I secretion periplasmic adaptor subunit [Motilimonas cestriensis]MCE2594729.1 HlyD family type I secretion periplasmic adaptor subunit [Motilimonas cestriensis]